jgi:hypothetical protein
MTDNGPREISMEKGKLNLKNKISQEYGKMEI